VVYLCGKQEGMFTVDPNDEAATLRYELEQKKREIDDILRKYDEKKLARRITEKFAVYLGQSPTSHTIMGSSINSFMRDIYNE